MPLLKPTADELTKYPCLSIRQPHAWLFASGQRRIENRSKPQGYRGLFWIHAPLPAPTMEELEDLFKNHDLDCPKRIEFYPRGAIVGRARLAGCWEHCGVPDQYKEEEPFVEGPYCWEILEPVRTEVVPVKGRLGLFTLSRDELPEAYR